ncbi:MAG: AsnC family transcriptional regulator [Candidatus Thermoplasmatota archaeon]|nr:AsnC family transcriptional regulator [Candidatus Thermoplasmatota archaeon]MBU4256753.1 AsnC family transcriptional regulator [Candidatus Thermoplasmatota archaeon]MCG2826993.1 winged helix-turn-helix transcriptional regulator [Thermoplasmatales archaeon]
MELDQVDVKILQTLQKDGRISFRELGKKLDVATPTISERVKRLENLGIIRGYSVVLDPEALGETTFLLTIEVKPGCLHKVEKKLKEMKEVKEIFVLSVCKLFAKITVLEGENRKVLTELEKILGIVDYDYSIILRAVKEEQRASITEGLLVNLVCAYCDASIKGEPVKIKIENRIHYVCCKICAKEYREKYEKWKKQQES